MPRKIFIDPSYAQFDGDKLFNSDDAVLNRDNQLAPYIRLQSELQRAGALIHTADAMLEEGTPSPAEYWSLGLTDKLDFLKSALHIQRAGFAILEPPLVAPQLYAALPELTRLFEKVYVYNVNGEGYSLKDVQVERLRKLYMPQPRDRVSEPHWNQVERSQKLVVIAGRHSARRRRPELYSARIRAIAELVKSDAVDLYGRGWMDYYSRQTVSLPYLWNFRALRAAYRGTCQSKLDTLSQYAFSLCLENMPMQGYLTEKIFDCFYAGTVPIYLGAPDIDTLVPADSYVDARQFSSWTEAWRFVQGMPVAQWQQKRECARDWVRGGEGRKYVDALVNMVGV